MSALTIKLRSDWHRVGAGLSVRFDLSGGCFDAEWRPRLPTKREWRRILDRYRLARHKFLVPMAADRSGSIVVVELPLDGEARHG